LRPGGSSLGTAGLAACAGAAAAPGTTTRSAPASSTAHASAATTSAATTAAAASAATAHAAASTAPTTSAPTAAAAHTAGQLYLNTRHGGHRSCRRSGAHPTAPATAATTAAPASTASAAASTTSAAAATTTTHATAPGATTTTTAAATSCGPAALLPAGARLLRGILGLRYLRREETQVEEAIGRGQEILEAHRPRQLQHDPLIGPLGGDLEHLRPNVTFVVDRLGEAAAPGGELDAAGICLDVPVVDQIDLLRAQQTGQHSGATNSCTQDGERDPDAND
jgi:hypothetical protein